MSKAGQKVIKYTHLEHVLKVPDTYVGSIESTQEEHYVLNDDGTKMVKKSINYTPGEYKIFDEILVNALDHYVRIKEKNPDLLFIDVSKIAMFVYMKKTLNCLEILTNTSVGLIA